MSTINTHTHTQLEANAPKRTRKFKRPYNWMKKATITMTSSRLANRPKEGENCKRKEMFSLPKFATMVELHLIIFVFNQGIQFRFVWLRCRSFLCRAKTKCPRFGNEFQLWKHFFDQLCFHVHACVSSISHELPHRMTKLIRSEFPVCKAIW